MTIVHIYGRDDKKRLFCRIEQWREYPYTVDSQFRTSESDGRTGTAGGHKKRSIALQ
jgi:hypothetical protein